MRQLEDTRNSASAPQSANQLNGKRAEPAGPRSDVLRRVLERVCTEVGRERFDRYFDRQTRVELDGTTVSVTVPSGFLADFMGRRFGDSIRRAAAAEISGTQPGANVELRIHVESPPEDAPATPAAPVVPGRGAGEAPAAPRRRLDPNEPRHSFDEFLVGESNKLAYTAALRLVESSGAGSGGLVFVHGVCGVGKTHILHAAAARFKELNPNARVRLTTAESFTNAFVSAIRGTPGSAGGQLGVEAFRRLHRNIDLLCIDDVHFLAGKEATQRELLATLESLSLTSRGAPRIMLASDEHPREIHKLSQQLVSRFMAGVVAKIETPEPALRVRLMHELARRRGLAIEPQAAQLLAERATASIPGRNGVAIGPSVRDLEGMLTRAAAIRLIMPDLAADRIGIIAAERALGLGEQSTKPTGGEWGRLRRPVPVPKIASVVCRYLGVEYAELSGRGRHKTVVLAREMTVLIARRLTTYSFPEIARALGRPNHSTVLTAHKRLSELIAAGEKPKADLSGELVGLSLGEIADRLTTMVEKAG